MSTPVSPTDPLGRIAAHAAEPYDHPAVSHKTMLRYWVDLYQPEAAALPDGDLATEHQRAIGAVAECEAAIATATTKQRRHGYVVGSWESEQEWRTNQIEATNLQHRIVRLEGKRDALAAEIARRERLAAPGAASEHGTKELTR